MKEYKLFSEVLGAHKPGYLESVTLDPSSLELHIKYRIKAG